MDTFAWQISRLLIYLYFVWSIVTVYLTYSYGIPEKHYLPVGIVIFLIAIALITFNWLSFGKLGLFISKPDSQNGEDQK